LRGVEKVEKRLREANVTRPEHAGSIVKQILIKSPETRHEKSQKSPQNKTATT
jgi:hypothetical protein